MTTGSNDRSAIRLLAIGLIIGLGAYWAGSRYGKPIPPPLTPFPSVAGVRQALTL